MEITERQFIAMSQNGGVPVMRQSLSGTIRRMSNRSFFRLFCLAAGAFALAACSPRFDWREVRGTDADYVILMPAKPATMTRPVDLNGIQVVMTMSAAEIDGISFALGTAELPDASSTQAALQAMKTALVRNINGTIRQEKSLPMQFSGTAESVEIEARGAPDRASGGQPRLLFGRFVSKDKRIFQAVVTGPEKNISRDVVDTFLTSFKPG